MDKTVWRQIGWVTASLGFTALLVGCGEMADGSANGDEIEQGAALGSTNGLAGINGLGLTNGLGSVNGLATTNGLMTTNAGRMTVKYLVKCALSSTDSLVKQDQNNQSYTFPGGLGLCPSWKTSG